MLPLGAGLMAAAAYMADTAASVEAPYAAFAVFIMGFFVVVLTTIGCVGTALQSRGIMQVFLVLIVLSSLVFAAFGAAAFAEADRVQAELTDNWEQVRKVLPPTFGGKYDKEQFERFVQDNLNVLGFMSLCTAIVLATQVFATCRLRSELKRRTELENLVDQLYAELQQVWELMRQRVEALAKAQQALRRNNRMSRQEVDTLAASIATEEGARYRALRARADQIQEDPEVDDEQSDRAEELVSADPPRKASDDDNVYALRRALYHRIRVRAHKQDVEQQLDVVEGKERREQGLMHEDTTGEDQASESGGKSP